MYSSIQRMKWGFKDGDTSPAFDWVAKNRWKTGFFSTMCKNERLQRFYEEESVAFTTRSYRGGLGVWGKWVYPRCKCLRDCPDLEDVRYEMIRDFTIKSSVRERKRTNAKVRHQHQFPLECIRVIWTDTSYYSNYCILRVSKRLFRAR